MNKIYKYYSKSLIILDCLFMNVSFFIPFFLYFGVKLGNNIVSEFWLSMIIINNICTIPVFYIIGLYKSIWKYAGVYELFTIFISTVLSMTFIITCTILKHINIPTVIYILQFFLIMCYMVATRGGYRIVRKLKLLLQSRYSTVDKRVLIIGAGQAGANVIKEITTHPEMAMKVIACVDDDSNKHGKHIGGIKVVCGREMIQEIAEENNIDEIIIAIPSASHKEKSEIWNLCKETNCEIKIVPGVYELVSNKLTVSQIRDVEIEDLLGRDPIDIDVKEYGSYIENKTVLITGGGGSIGSELCRQVMDFNPNQLIILDIYENNAYDLKNELDRQFPNNNNVVIIASVADEIAMDKLFNAYKIDVVFHAAAHKHVPLMEDSPCQAIKNNIFGTYTVAKTSSKYGVKRFILISTDKAVKPTNIMGATKRVAEMIIQGIDKVSKTEFVAVRFGNVLGSNGSVIPLFKRQIQQGGPVTLTHPEITRFFMLIPEAVRLVLQAGAMANGGEIFILDMGKPVKIVDLAKKLIQLSGLKEGKDIEIKYIGLRPGEKLYEELLLDEEGLKQTLCEKIYIGQPVEQSYELLVKELKMLWNERDNEKFIIAWLEKWVVGYKNKNDYRKVAY